MPTGKGRLVYKNGDIHSGSFLNGLREGFGEFMNTSNNGFKGKWVDDKKNGKFTNKYRDGSQFEGFYYDDHKNSHGTLKYSNGDEYVGDFKNDLPNGKGVINFNVESNNHNYKYFEGIVLDGKFNGFGLLVYKNENQYQGEFLNGLKNGRGKYIDIEQKKCFTGAWKNNVRDGVGKIENLEVMEAPIMVNYVNGTQV